MSAHAPEAAGKGTDALLVQIGISSRKSCLKWLLLLGLQCTWTVWTVMLIRNKEEVHIALYCHVSRVTSHVTNLGSLLFLIRTLPRSTSSPLGHHHHQSPRRPWPAVVVFCLLMLWANIWSYRHFILSENKLPCRIASGNNEHYRSGVSLWSAVQSFPNTGDVRSSGDGDSIQQ